ncbi:MAG TPA: hypothetical protein VG897_11470 [Terriglobales bacterium]|nr:hypothetical protein [Terriglobales bacterium]
MFRLRSVGILSAAKISALLYGGIALLFVPVLLIMAAMTFAPKSESQAPAWLFVILAVFAPVLYGVMGFVSGALAALVYNLVSRWVGGLELQFDVALPMTTSTLPPVPQS